MSEILEGAEPPEFTAVIAANDLVAIGCCDALYERGLAPGSDISVAGFNGMDFLDRLAVPLTSVRIPHRELGDHAAALLLELIERNDVGSAAMSAELPVELVPRASTAPPRCFANAGLEQPGTQDFGSVESGLARP